LEKPNSLSWNRPSGNGSLHWEQSEAIQGVMAICDSINNRLIDLVLLCASHLIWVLIGYKVVSYH